MIRAPIDTSLSVKIRRFSNIFSKISTVPVAWVATATAIDVRSAGNIGHGPSSIFGIWAFTSSTIRSVWPGGTRTELPVDLDRDPEPREGVPDRAQVLDRGVLDHDVAARDGGEADERRHLDVVGADAVGAAAERLTPWIVSTFDPMPSMRAPIAVEQVAQILHVRLACGVFDRRLARASTAAMTAFSVPVTEASSR